MQQGIFASLVVCQELAKTNVHVHIHICTENLRKCIDNDNRCKFASTYKKLNTNTHTQTQCRYSVILYSLVLHTYVYTFIVQQYMIQCMYVWYLSTGSFCLCRTQKLGQAKDAHPPGECIFTGWKVAFRVLFLSKEAWAAWAWTSWKPVSILEWIRLLNLVESRSFRNSRRLTRTSMAKQLIGRTWSTWQRLIKTLAKLEIDQSMYYINNHKHAF